MSSAWGARVLEAPGPGLDVWPAAVMTVASSSVTSAIAARRYFIDVSVVVSFPWGWVPGSRQRLAELVYVSPHQRGAAMLSFCYSMVHSVGDCCRLNLSLRCHASMSKICGIRAPSEK